MSYNITSEFLIKANVLGKKRRVINKRFRFGLLLSKI